MRVDDYIKRIGQSDIGAFVLDGRQLQQLQAIELKMAEDIINYCDRHEIEYMLGGGSVLGALRHHGFIPWDDDIDINITRVGWERFYQGFQVEYAEKYRVQSPETDSGCNINAIRIYYLGTKLRELSAPPDEAGGIFVDLFILENAPDNAVLRILHGLLCSTLRYICSCRRYHDQRKHFEIVFANNKAALRGFRLRAHIGRLFSLISTTRLVSMSSRANSLCKNDNTKYITVPTGQRRYFGELIKRKDILPPTKARFENHLWNVPQNAELYLTKLYGGWRQIPSPDEREQHVLLELNFGKAGEGISTTL